MKKSTQTNIIQDQLESLTNIEKNIFHEEKGKIFIGDEEIKPELLSSLKDDASFIVKTRLYSIIMDTMKNEAYKKALDESGNFDHVLFAKALKHFTVVFEKIILKLKK